MGLGLGRWELVFGVTPWLWSLALGLGFGLLAYALAFVLGSDLGFLVFALQFGFGLEHRALALDTGRTLWLWS